MDEGRNRLVLKVNGMTCQTCERRVEEAAGSVKGVVEARADRGRCRLTLGLDPQAPENEILAGVEAAVAAAGYTVGQADGSETRGTAAGLIIGAGLIAVFFWMNSQGWFNALPAVNSSVGLGMVFVAGLLTSVHCLAMCGGIALSQQARARSPLRGWPYHLGRVVAYTILGGVVGALGAVVSFSPVAQGVLVGLAGLFMVGLGLRMLGWLPLPAWFRLPRLPRLLPVRWTLALGKRGPFFVGLLNGFMPCGPLQTMQLYALGTGSAALGALSLFLFSLGTVPLMFAFGALGSFFPARWQRRMVKASALLVVCFGVVMAGRALDLSGTAGQVQTLVDRIGPAAPVLASLPDQQNRAVVRNGVQYVGFDLQPRSYQPITVQKGVPVEWTIHAAAANLNGCNGEIVVPQLHLRQKLEVGANLIRFTPETAGTITYTCWMGMISSSIRVVDRLDNPSADPAQPNLPATGSGLGSPGCCSASTAPAFARGKVPTDRVAVAQFKTAEGRKYQEVTVTVDDQGYSPAVLVVQKGVPARIKFVPKKLSGCNSFVDFPAYGTGLDLARGQVQTPLIPVVQDFVFQCGMAMLHGYVRVVDDLSQVDLDEVRATAAAWKPETPGCCGG